MKKITVTRIVFYSLLLLSGVTYGCDDVGVVYYYGFDIERITGITEPMIVEYGDLYYISSTDFLNYLSPSTSRNYQSNDIRAKICFYRDNCFYVDKDGFVRNKKKFYILDKIRFEKGLLLPKKHTSFAQSNSCRTNTDRTKG